ncbi:putative tricarboxylic transport membrane protein [Stella humosa]|uniref:Putative tricarboxylic transport membrane protein n=1 Tax=Stella humosa TaxID=94 RepID=A0A3N1M1H2_9PROT|nr:tripartite tricarboxylate transporter TctB family protein [Stella humosa]ROQ01364.1 putative tricarboxylic transport membrane protein [Stella humosa]BBK31738.1 hypothetical protein STHU_23720 [Stella humosa]
MRPDLPSGLLWLAAGAFVAWEGYELGLGSANDPGSGFVLFWVGLLLVVLALVQLGQALARPAEAGIRALWRDLHWWKPVGAVVVLAIYAVALLPVGYLLSTFAFLLVLMLAVDRNPPVTAATVALSATAITFLVFDKWLGVGLPRGIFYL